MSEKKIVLITGATRGIGLAILKEMSKHNYIVLGTGTNENSVNALKNDDLPVVMGITLIISIIFVVINIIVDVLYSIIDPRVVLK